jgi:hypothetical protein
MIKRIFAIACTGTVLSLGINGPVLAQSVEVTPGPTEDDSFITDPIDDTGVIDPTGDTGVIDSTDDTGVVEDTPTGLDQNNLEGIRSNRRSLPGVGEVYIENVIIIDGRAYGYNREVIDRLLQEGALTPLESGGSDVLSNDTSEATEASNTTNTSEANDGGLVTYPPADSIEDLEPEDILAP